MFAPTPRNEKKYRFYQIWLFSFFSPGLYREVAEQWRGTGFIYLFFLLGICWIPLIYFIVNGLVFFKTNVLTEFLQEIPTMNIVNGELFINEGQPFVFPDKNDPFLIIDTSGVFNDISNTQAEILLTKKQLSIQSRNGLSSEVHHYPLPDSINLSLEREALQQKLMPLFNQMIFFIYPILLCLSLAYRFFQSMLFAVLGYLILNPVFRTTLSYTAVMRVMAVALTPAIVISTILSTMHINIEKEFVLYLLLSLTYLCFGIRANRCYPYA